MRNRRLLPAALSGLLIITAMSSIAFAGQIQPTVNVNGTLNGVCRAGVAGSLSFSIDPALAGPLSATVTDATVFCSNGTVFTVTAESTNKGGGPASCASGGGGITGTLKDASNNPMDYTFTCGVDDTAGNTGTGKGHGAGKDVPLGLAGSIAAVSYQNAPVGNYADTVTLTITY